MLPRSPSIQSLCRYAVASVAVLAFAAPVFANTFVRFEFNLQDASQQGLDTVFIELFDDRPLSRDNFLQYIDGGHYEGTFMHRLVPGFVLQGGGFYDDPYQVPTLNNQLAIDQDPVDLDGNPGTPNPTVDNEFDNTPFRSNLRGTIAYAKTAAGPDSATNQFFFNLANNSANLDNQNGGFTVFAQVVGNGMDLVDAFAGLNTLDLNEDLAEFQTLPGGQVIQTGSEPDGIRDPGAFGDVPALGSVFNYLPLIVETAERVTYLGAGSVTDTSSSFTFRNQDGYIDTGATFTGAGRILINPGVTLGIADNQVIGQGMSNRGTVAPGLQTGDFEVLNFVQFEQGELNLQLGGNEAGVNYDQVVATQYATLDGALDVSLLAGFVPQGGDQFTLIDVLAGALHGDFATVNLPEVDQVIMHLDVGTQSNDVVLTAIGGDYNNDGAVTAADYQLWRTNFGSTEQDVAGDGNRDGVVDAVDYTVWRNGLELYQQLVSPAGGGAAAVVPEPTTAILMLFGALIVGTTSRRR